MCIFLPVSNTPTPRQEPDASQWEITIVLQCAYVSSFLWVCNNQYFSFLINLFFCGLSYIVGIDYWMVFFLLHLGMDLTADPEKTKGDFFSPK